MGMSSEIGFEVGQILHNNPVGFPASDFLEALFLFIRKKLRIVYWNVNQEYSGNWHTDREFDDIESDPLKDSEFDTKIPGLEWRGYYNWAGSPEDDDWDQVKANRPNFKFEDVEVRWYKNFGRSLNVNVKKSPDEWVSWFERCVKHLEDYERKNCEAFRRMDEAREKFRKEKEAEI